MQKNHRNNNTKIILYNRINNCELEKSIETIMQKNQQRQQRRKPNRLNKAENPAKPTAIQKNRIFNIQ